MVSLRSASVGLGAGSVYVPSLLTRSVPPAQPRNSSSRSNGLDWRCGQVPPFAAQSESTTQVSPVPAPLPGTAQACTLVSGAMDVPSGRNPCTVEVAADVGA